MKRLLLYLLATLLLVAGCTRNGVDVPAVGEELELLTSSVIDSAVDHDAETVVDATEDAPVLGVDAQKEILDGKTALPDDVCGTVIVPIIESLTGSWQSSFWYEYEDHRIEMTLAMNGKGIIYWDLPQTDFTLMISPCCSYVLKKSSMQFVAMSYPDMMKMTAGLIPNFYGHELEFSASGNSFFKNETAYYETYYSTNGTRLCFFVPLFEDEAVVRGVKIKEPNSDEVLDIVFETFMTPATSSLLYLPYNFVTAGEESAAVLEEVERMLSLLASYK